MRNLMKQQPDILEAWVIYDRPSDYPTLFVARKWLVLPDNPTPQPTSDALFDLSLDVLRSRLPSGLFRVPRTKNDDVTIVEVWL